MILEREHLDNLMPFFDKQGDTDDIMETLTDQDLKVLGVEKLGGLGVFLRPSERGQEVHLTSRQWFKSAAVLWRVNRNLQESKWKPFALENIRLLNWNGKEFDSGQRATDSKSKAVRAMAAAIQSPT
jgi:hypothetical protein